jgi:hypothetical protein
MIKSKLRSGVNWQGTLKQKGRKTRATCSSCPGNLKCDTTLIYVLPVADLYITQFDSALGNADLVSMHYDDESRRTLTPAEEAAGFTDTLYTAGPQPKFLRIPLPSSCVTQHTHFERGPTFFRSHRLVSTKGYKEVNERMQRNSDLLLNGIQGITGTQDVT